MNEWKIHYITSKSLHFVRIIQPAPTKFQPLLNRFVANISHWNLVLRWNQFRINTVVYGFARYTDATQTQLNANIHAHHTFLICYDREKRNEFHPLLRFDGVKYLCSVYAQLLDWVIKTFRFFPLMLFPVTLQFVWLMCEYFGAADSNGFTV